MKRHVLGNLKSIPLNLKGKSTVKQWKLSLKLLFRKDRKGALTSIVYLLLEQDTLKDRVKHNIYSAVLPTLHGK